MKWIKWKECVTHVVIICLNNYTYIIIISKTYISIFQAKNKDFIYALVFFFFFFNKLKTNSYKLWSSRNNKVINPEQHGCWLGRLSSTCDMTTANSIHTAVDLDPCLPHGNSQLFPYVTEGWNLVSQKGR